MLIGYARISTDDQNLNLQKDALVSAGCEKIYSDRISGAKATRAGLTLALEVARTGDVLIVWRLDRLGRSLKDLIEILTFPVISLIERSLTIPLAQSPILS
ncbi:transposon DNA-invertase [Nostoc sphaeroides CCNUC1]|uniref:Transposon DNA-invertase n=1 Tax=Nostoc sphaeroides CCNUC1 TaxID=2653204 RepID=A0A5P8WDG8_9NOSO|nr:transposon DNA-invertase [Nostoc sphaeroides CCNUC1]